MIGRLGLKRLKAYDVRMVRLTLTNVPEDLAARLEARAAVNARSPAEEAEALLRVALEGDVVGNASVRATNGPIALADIQAEAQTLLSGETIDAFIAWRRGQWGT